MSNLIFALISILFLGVAESPSHQVNKDSVSLQKSISLSWGHGDSATYLESQIRKADSLYKNYLPQYNFDEIKAAMEFFDSYQQSAISGQRWRLFDKEADDRNRLIAESRQLTAANI